MVIPPMFKDGTDQYDHQTYLDTDPGIPGAGTRSRRILTAIMAATLRKMHNEYVYSRPRRRTVRPRASSASGGMAQVHIGTDTRLGRTVAIKIMRSDLAEDSIFLTRFPP